MSEKRKIFPHDTADIILHADGTLTITAEADYGDSNSGWGTTTTYVDFTPEQLLEFRKFLETDITEATDEGNAR